jgi:ferritin-like metal-binding protein YciE
MLWLAWCFHECRFKHRWLEEEMAEAKFEDLFRQYLEELYDAEKQIVEALPKMIAASSSEELARALQDHLGETKEQVTRLDNIFELIGEQPSGRECEGMKGLLREGENVIARMSKSPVLDAAIAAAAQKVEHYEISAYSTARAIAEMLGQESIADLLLETLEEERAADDTLSEVVDNILTGDSLGDEGDEEEEEEEESV